jgi:hypothetical protein
MAEVLVPTFLLLIIEHVTTAINMDRNPSHCCVVYRDEFRSTQVETYLCHLPMYFVRR